MKKLKNLHFLIAFAGLAFFFLSCNKDEDIVLDFNLTVPDNWTYSVLANKGPVYSAARSPVNEQDTVGEWIYAYKQPLQGYDLASYFTAIASKIEDFQKPEYISTLEKKDTSINGTDFKRIITEEIEHRLTASKDTVDINRVYTYYFFYEKENGYYIQLASVDTLYDENKPVFDGIMHTFQYKY